MYLRGLEQRHFDRYTDYVLGDKCYQLLVPGPQDKKQPLHPPWHILLDYEFELRKRAIRRAHKEGTPLYETLKEATEDTELKELHFTSPVTFAAMERPNKAPKWEQEQIKGGKGKGKGKKGKEQTKTSYLPGTKLELITHAPDGKQICYRYNMKGKKRRQMQRGPRLSSQGLPTEPSGVRTPHWGCLTARFTDGVSRARQTGFTTACIECDRSEFIEGHLCVRGASPQSRHS